MSVATIAARLTGRVPRINRGILARAGVALAIIAAVLVTPILGDSTWDQRIGLAAIFGVIGLSVNVLTGHAGQISLGHQAFVGIGAFMSAFLVSRAGLGFFPAVITAGIAGAAMAAFLGMVALRIGGLYLALVTLSFGLMAETTIFNWTAFTGGGAGAEAPRPAAFTGDGAYAYLCIAFLAGAILLDWRLVKSKAGRAIVAFRSDENVASTLGINVTWFKLLAFMTSGFMAGIAGALFAHWNQFVQALDFQLNQALVWVLMAVVGGLGSRAGVVVGSAFFAIFPSLFPGSTISLPYLGNVIVQVIAPLVGALLLLLTLTLHPGGIGEQLMPIRRWLAGGKLIVRKQDGKKKRHRTKPVYSDDETDEDTTPVSLEEDTAVPVQIEPPTVSLDEPDAAPDDSPTRKRRKRKQEATS